MWSRIRARHKDKKEGGGERGKEKDIRWEWSRIVAQFSDILGNDPRIPDGM
jgi:hypothetical protein